MGWPCRLWSSLTNLNFVTPEEKQRLRRLSQKEKPILELFEDLTYLQLARGDHIIGENPLWSKALEEKPILKVLECEECHIIRTDACSHGLKDPTTGKYMLKPTALITSHPVFDILGTRCSGEHEHVPMEGAMRCRTAARYTRKFGRRVVRALERAV